MAHRDQEPAGPANNPSHETTPTEQAEPAAAPTLPADALGPLAEQLFPEAVTVEFADCRQRRRVEVMARRVWGQLLAGEPSGPRLAASRPPLEPRLVDLYARVRQHNEQRRAAEARWAALTWSQKLRQVLRRWRRPDRRKP
ncbi:MAG: hypothetical protein CMJ58_12565 [Planctomycetaceae bacterium]|nr:hypothetical protein [Planctomycetaceae bacterium]